MSRVGHGQSFVLYCRLSYVRHFSQMYRQYLARAFHVAWLHIPLLFAVLSRYVLVHVLVASQKLLVLLLLVLNKPLFLFLFLWLVAWQVLLVQFLTDVQPLYFVVFQMHFHDQVIVRIRLQPHFDSLVLFFLQLK